MRNAIIIGLVVLILLLSGAWVYLLLNGSPDSMDEVRTTLFGTSPDAPQQPIVDSGNVMDTDSGSGDSGAVPVGAVLSKLTSKHVAGAMFADDMGEPVVRYMEKGTGNVYQVSLTTGTEMRLSNETIPGAVAAIWAKTGMRVVILTENEGARGDMMLGTLTKSDTGEVAFDVESIASAGDVDNIAWDDVGDAVMYTRKSPGGGAAALRHNFKSNSTESLFTAPFGECVVLWDTSGGDAHYVYPKPALNYRGYLYRVAGNALKKVGEGTTLHAGKIGSHTIFQSQITDGGIGTLLFDTDTNSGPILTLPLVKEKCAGNVIMWCGADPGVSPSTYPIAWYLGNVSYADRIWRIDPTTGEGGVVADPESIARETIDMIDLVVSDAEQVIFRNKKDDSLWLFNPPAPESL